MTIRIAVVASTVLALAACGSAADGPELVYRSLVPDSLAQATEVAVSPDGTRLAWSGEVGPRSAIFVSGIDGSDPVRLTHGVWDQTPRWSPDGSLIAYYSDVDADVWLVPSAGGEPRQLTSGPAIDGPLQWLPDGSAVVVYRRGGGPGQTVVVPLDGGPERSLVPAMGGDEDVVLSPDGSMAAINLHRGGSSTIWVQALDGSPARQLTTEGLEDGWPSRHMWSPDGSRLVFTSRRTGTNDLWTVDVATGELHQVTTDLREDWGHRWSPDGRRIAFLSDRGGQTDLWIVADTGGTALRVTNDLPIENEVSWSTDGTTLFYSTTDLDAIVGAASTSDGSFRELAGWAGVQSESARLSPDGGTVLFASDRLGPADIWSVPFAGGEATPFVSSPADDFDPNYSPDGDMVAFISTRAGSADLWVVPAAGGDPRQLTDWMAGEWRAEWSPDGRMLAFFSNHENSAASGLDLWVVSAAGGEPRRVTEGGRIVRDEGGPRWAPDGRTIFFVAFTPTGTRELYRVAVEGGTPEAVSMGANPVGGAVSPDGEHYAYANYTGGLAFLEVIPTAGGTPRRLSVESDVGNWDVSPLWSPDGSELFFNFGDYTGTVYRSSLAVFSWPEGVLRRITTPTDVVDNPVIYNPEDVTADGSQLIALRRGAVQRIYSVNVAELLKDE